MEDGRNKDWNDDSPVYSTVLYVCTYSSDFDYSTTAA
jgi:hypothetical protein